MAYEDYMPGGDYYLPEGAGEFQTGGGDWQGIYAPPAPQSGGYSGPTQYGSNASYSPNHQYTGDSAWMNSGQPSLYSQVQGGGGQRPMMQQPSGGQRSMSQQTPQQIDLGQPQDDLYKRYKSLLMNPDFSGDPSYQFLYNQGLQSLNRNLAAQRQTLSGKSMNDTMAYGSGMASKYMQDLLPQYKAGAGEELNRFMGPAGLLSQYARTNNAAIGQANNQVNNSDMMNAYGGGGNLGLDKSGFTASGGNGIGWGGVNNQQNMGARSQASPGYTPRPLSFNENYSPSGQFDPYYNGLDIEGGQAYG